MMTPAQLRAARALLGWSREDLEWRSPLESPGGQRPRRAAQWYSIDGYKLRDGMRRSGRELSRRSADFTRGSRQSDWRLTGARISRVPALHPRFGLGKPGREDLVRNHKMMSLDKTDMALLQRVLEVFEAGAAGPLVAAPDDEDRARLDRLTADGFLTAWPVNVRDTLYAITDRGRKASKATQVMSVRQST